MARGRKTDDSTRAAIMAALLAGQGVNEVASQFKVDKSVVSRMKAKLSPEQLQQVATKKENDFGALLGAYLTETLTTLAAQARFFRNETWLRRQSAAEVATLHGVQTDKAIRLLEAIERAHSQEDNPAA